MAIVNAIKISSVFFKITLWILCSKFEHNFFILMFPVQLLELEHIHIVNQKKQKSKKKQKTPSI